MRSDLGHLEFSPGDYACVSMGALCVLSSREVKQQCHAPMVVTQDGAELWGFQLGFLTEGFLSMGCPMATGVSQSVSKRVSKGNRAQLGADWRNPGTLEWWV